MRREEDAQRRRQPPHQGWSAEVVASAVRACEERSLAERLEREVAESLGVEWESLCSVWHQLNAAATRKTAHVHRERAPKQYRAAYERGESIMAMAKRVEFSPYLLARLLVEVLLDVPRKAVGELVKDVSKIPDARLRRDVVECAERDGHYSPKHDVARREVGLRHERLLERKLEERRIPYAREEDLRQRGFAKTPDVLLEVPLAYLRSRDDDGEEGSSETVHVVNWIDSKAMFGLPATYHNEHRSQLQGYVNRLGPGAVLYWFGFADELQHVDNHVLLLAAWPESDLYWPDGLPVRLVPDDEDGEEEGATAVEVEANDEKGEATRSAHDDTHTKENAPPPLAPPPGLMQRALLPRKIPPPQQQQEGSSSSTDRRGTGPSRLTPTTLVARPKP